MMTTNLHHLPLNDRWIGAVGLSSFRSGNVIKRLMKFVDRNSLWPLTDPSHKDLLFAGGAGPLLSKYGTNALFI